jgi:hypothetical protein
MVRTLVPEGVKPVIPAVAVAVHENVAPDTLDVRLTMIDGEPEHTDCVRTLLLTLGMG